MPGPLSLAPGHVTPQWGQIVKNLKSGKNLVVYDGAGQFHTPCLYYRLNPRCGAKIVSQAHLADNPEFGQAGQINENGQGSDARRAHAGGKLLDGPCGRVGGSHTVGNPGLDVQDNLANFYVSQAHFEAPMFWVQLLPHA
jgi:hypothetical protein